MSTANVDPEELDIRFKRPESQVLSVRLNADESRVLTEAARLAKLKLSTFVKEAALEVASRRAHPRRETHIGGTVAGRVIVVNSGGSQRFVSGSKATDVTFLGDSARDTRAVS